MHKKINKIRSLHVLKKLQHHCCKYDRESKHTRWLTCLGSSGIKGFTSSLQSGADAAASAMRDNRNTTTGRAMVSHRDVCRTCNRKRLTLIHFPSGLHTKSCFCVSANPEGGGGGEERVWGWRGFLQAQMHQRRFPNDHACSFLLLSPLFFFSALKGELNSPLLPTPLLLNELRQSATSCLGLLKSFKKDLEQLFCSRMKDVSLWGCSGLCVVTV